MAFRGAKDSNTEELMAPPGLEVLADNKKQENAGKKQRQAKESRKCFNKLLTKTQMCVFHMQGTCRFGPDCTFAHSPSEMRQAPNFSKTELCPYGTQCNDSICRYAHNLSEMRSARKATPCAWHAVGACRNGTRCPYSHDAKVVKQHGERSGPKAPPMPSPSFMNSSAAPFEMYGSPLGLGGVSPYFDSFSLPVEPNFPTPLAQRWESWQMEPMKLPLPGTQAIDSATTMDTLGAMGSDSDDSASQSDKSGSEKSKKKKQPEATAHEIVALLEMKCNLEQELLRTLAYNNVQMDEMMDMNMAGYSSEAPGLEAWLTA